jgi:hypothetical protein
MSSDATTAVTCDCCGEKKTFASASLGESAKVFASVTVHYPIPVKGGDMKFGTASDINVCGPCTIILRGIFKKIPGELFGVEL